MRPVVLLIGCLVLSLMFKPTTTSVIAAGNEPDMVFLGDSNTASNHWENGSYVRKLKDLGSPWQDLNLINSGRDGWGAYAFSNGADNIRDLVIDWSPRYLLIALGGNDFLIFRDVDKFRSDYQYLLDQIVEMNSSIKQIYVANIYWGTLEVPANLVKIYRQYQEVIANASVEYGFPLIDFYNTTLDHKEYYQSDAIHLNEEGHKAIASVIDTTIGLQIQQDLSEISSNWTDTDSEFDSTSEDAPYLIVWSTLILIYLMRRWFIAWRSPERHDS